MHELSIAMSLLDMAEEELHRQGGGRLIALHLKLGPLSGVVKEALLGAFELARETTDFPDCRLQIEEMPILINCTTCGSIQPARSIQEICCQQCGTSAMNVVSGRELELTAMELRDEPTSAKG
jgi:hydrogenase nickel incorporation protein HypA/HybF